MKLSIVTTMYYSRDYLHEFYLKTIAAVRHLNLSYEFIFVDDGSPDDSLRVAIELLENDSNIKVIQLSKNFGHQRAIMTGLQNTTGDYVFLIDCDLEEDPGLLNIFWETIMQHPDLDVAYGVQIKRKGGWFERISGRFFYKVLSVLSSIEYPADTLTSRIMSRNYIEAIKKFQEKELDLWGVFVLAGFKQIGIPVSKGHKGSSTYTLMKKIRRGTEIVTSFSNRPLYVTFFLGIISFFVAAVIISVIIYKKYFLQVDVEGWASILASVWLVGGMILLMLGIFGVYLSKMFLEIKNRPLTIIKNVYSK
ncbi:MAG: glycosyltransferase family 2 protein [Cyclobacteriaceae bacterium]